jgi:ribosomal protein S18 acetylase RimI-like enzyme
MSSSSIGAAWPPEATSHHRVRGFYDEGVLRTSYEALNFAEAYQHIRTDFENQDKHTRLSVRFVAQTTQLQLLDAAGVQLEAAIPLTTTKEAGLVLAYAGHNQPGRDIGLDQQQAHEQSLDRVVDSPQPVRRSIPAHVIDNTTSDVERAQLAPQFLQLYSQFGYNQAEVHELLGNPNNTIMFIERDGQVVSTAMAEQAIISIKEFGPLKITEITEAATHPDYRQQGLYAAVSGLLLNHLVERQNDDPQHAIYGESNLAMPGVLFAAHHNGRRFSYLDRKDYSLDTAGFGILPQNFHISDGEETRQYNDFAVSYLPLNNGVRT